jgi:hypothetical protein
MPSPDAPLTGGCPCGTVRFEVTAPFKTAGYCHCKRCQRRSGTYWTPNALADGAAFAIVAGADAVRTWRPEGGKPKSFCGECGGHLFSGVPGDDAIGVRLGALDGDPEIEMTWRQWLDSAPAWEPIPDDGTERFAGSRF